MAQAAPESIYFVVATVILLFSLHGSKLGGPAKIAVIIVAALIQMIMPLLGHATISKILRYLAYVFIVFFAVLAGFTFNKLHLSGFHWPAIIAQVVGMVAALMWINAGFAFPAYTGPISNHFPGLAGGDFSWAIGIVVGALLYWALAGRGVRQEAAQATPPRNETGIPAPQEVVEPGFHDLRATRRLRLRRTRCPPGHTG